MKSLKLILKQKLYRFNCAEENEKDFAILWIFAVLPPLLILLIFVNLQHWEWGLMDDTQILNIGSGIIDRAFNYLINRYQAGLFRPISVIHSAVFYTIFENTPTWFYVFRLLEICLVLFIWGICTYRITKKKIAFILLSTITLSFHYFYDSFFNLSTQEIIGLFFIGIALYFLLINLEHILGSDFNGKKGGNKLLILQPTFLTGLFFLLCAYGSKEPFVSCGIAFGLSYIYLAFKYRRSDNFRGLLLSGMFLIAITVIYGIFLLIAIKSEYTSKYSLAIPKLFSSFKDWFKKDFINHSPWIFGVSFIYCFSFRFLKEVIKQFSLKMKWGIILGILFYLGYLFLLAPWGVLCFYATPFGLFFAFITVLLISQLLSRISIRLHILIIMASLILNLLICQYALVRESAYQYDTINFAKWFKTYTYSYKGKDNYCIQCSAEEPSITLSQFINRKYELRIDRFKYLPNPSQVNNSEMCEFYLYCTRFHAIDQSRFKNWEVIFFSKNWIMFQKPKK